MQPTNSGERLQKVIARSGLTSRRRADAMILSGRVSVNGQTAPPGLRVNPSQDQILVDGVHLPVDPDQVYYLLNKPPGVISTTYDGPGRKTVVDLVPVHPKVFPVGRLDAESTGLLILTNDGPFANQVTHPRHGVNKIYEVLVKGVVSPSGLARLRQGVELEDGPAVPVKIRIIDTSGNTTHLELTMSEGRNREVRRLCDAAGFPVTDLHRVAIGPLRDRTLKTGSWRNLKIDEVRAFYKHSARGRRPARRGR
ncbi:MAG: rRNA pseudouridine synthase [Acidimicrobiia bacterium]|nr:pseudouridine synthase [bacterium]MCY3652144.1 pseudouridine synthase [bacterium]MXZ06051.1 rRNA pseudouridine synthase [Acidimicrobiia bacterium]MYH54600.1 rRNA pseudouridine synthase [Acidimicrobiia bacterium]